MHLSKATDTCEQGKKCGQDDSIASIDSIVSYSYLKGSNQKSQNSVKVERAVWWYPTGLCHLPSSTPGLTLFHQGLVLGSRWPTD